MPTQDLATTLANIEKKLKEFLPGRAKETFYSLRIDANAIGLNSEERFAQTKANYIETWKEENQPLDAAKIKKLGPEALEDEFYEIHRLVEGSKKRPAMSLDDAIRTVNDARVSAMADGCPYEKPDSEEYAKIRHTGSCSYGELVQLGLSKEYRAHYDMDDEAQKDSAYAKAVREIVAAIDGDRKRFFGAAKLTPDFRVHSVEHGY